jgi:hypothetical protein
MKKKFEVSEITPKHLIEALTLEQLIAFRDELQSEIANQFGMRRAFVLADIKATMSTYGITPQIIEESMKKRRGPRKHTNGAA